MTFVREGPAAGPAKYELLDSQHQTSGTTLNYSVPGSTLSAVGDQLKFWGTFGGVSDDTIEFRWGGALLYGAPAADVGAQGSFEGVIQKRGTNQQHCSFKVNGRLAAFSGIAIGIAVDATATEASANVLDVRRGGINAVLSLNTAIVRA